MQDKLLLVLMSLECLHNLLYPTNTVFNQAYILKVRTVWIYNFSFLLDQIDSFSINFLRHLGKKRYGHYYRRKLDNCILVHLDQKNYQ